MLDNLKSHYIEISSSIGKVTKWSKW